MSLPPEMFDHYSTGYEENRLSNDMGRLEFLRSQEIILRYFPEPFAKVADIGGGPGAYSLWLARLGYEPHLIDATPLHVEQARRAAASQPNHPLGSARVGDARRLDFEDASFDAALLFGPLYHLTQREDRIRALSEARRILKPDGVVLCAVISRFASTFDGIARFFLDDEEFQRIVERDLRDGQHRNPANRPHYFTTAFFHHPSEIKSEVEEAGLRHEKNLPVEGPFWSFGELSEHWRDEGRRERLLRAIRSIENEESLIGASAHIIAVARRAD
jgi:ubiquinone/menaquinone biosynthesis C-methylase UbiE